MLVARIADQLGNQMFTYASVKTIAQNRQEPFGFVREWNDRINDSDRKYGNEIHTIFPAIHDEFLEQLPAVITHTYAEPPLSSRTANYQADALQVPTDTLMIGHYISYRYFADNLEEVRRWFAFPEDIADPVDEELAALRAKYPGRPLVAVHFRIGEDYVRQGFRLRDSYWKKAADYVLTQVKDPIFLLFYDRKPKKGGLIDYFTSHFTCEICRGSLVHDLCMLSRCDWEIICNSSFSIMSAVLNTTSSNQIVRPSVYPVGRQFYPTDCFCDDWIVVPASQSLQAASQCRIMYLKGQILKLIRK